MLSALTKFPAEAIVGPRNHRPSPDSHLRGAEPIRSLANGIHLVPRTTVAASNPACQGSIVRQNYDAFARSVEIVDGGRVLYEERAFPVVELARELLAWIVPRDGPVSDFVFNSMSFADPGSVSVVADATDWKIGSIFEPEAWSQPLRLDDLRSFAVSFVERVHVDMEGLELNANTILGCDIHRIRRNYLGQASGASNHIKGRHR